MEYQKVSFYFDTKVQLLDAIDGEENLQKYKVMSPKNMRFSLWVWLHPSAYALIHWGIPFCAFFQVGVLKTLSLYWSHFLLTFFMWVFLISGVITLYLQYKKWKFRKGTTLYEIYLQNI